MTNTEFIESRPLERTYTTKNAKIFERALNEANGEYVIIWKKQKGIKVGRVQYWDFYVHCPTTSFANAYAHIGELYAIYRGTYLIKK